MIGRRVRPDPHERARLRRERRRRRRRGWGGLLLGAAAGAVFAAGLAFPETVDRWYGRHLYPLLASTLAGFGEDFTTSLFELVVALLVLALVAAVPEGIVRGRRRGEGWPGALLSGVVLLAGRIGAAWFAFVLLWGMNYARPFPAAAFGLAPTLPDPQRVAELSAAVGARTVEVRKAVVEDAAGVADGALDVVELDRHLARLQAEVLHESGLPPIHSGRTKVLRSSPLLLRWGVSGVYGPPFAEPNIVVPSAPALLPFTIAHERAHLSGFATEDAASFVALLTCWRSTRPEVRYAGWLALTLNLPTARPAAATVRRDLAALSAFLAQHRGREAPAMWKAYDQYLKAHGVDDGTASYQRMAELALRHLAARGLPVEPLVIR